MRACRISVSTIKPAMLHPLHDQKSYTSAGALLSHHAPLDSQGAGECGMLRAGGGGVERGPRGTNCLSIPARIGVRDRPAPLQTADRRRQNIARVCPLLHANKLHHHYNQGKTAPRSCLPAVTMSSEPLSSLYWPPDVAGYSMESMLYSSSGWMRTACIVFALFWCAQLYTRRQLQRLTIM
jgi:hypothetical protein